MPHEWHWFIESFTEAELEEVKQKADHALVLAPDLAEAHVALGVFYYYGYRHTIRRWPSFSARYNCSRTTLRPSEYPATFIAGKGNGLVVWKSFARLSK